MQVTHQGTVDPETGEALQTVYMLSDDASTTAMEMMAARCQAVLWSRIRSGNERKWIKAELVKRRRRELLKALREKKEKVDEQGILAEEKHITSGMVRLAAEIQADAQLAGEDPDTCMARLQAEVDAEEAKRTQAA